MIGCEDVCVICGERGFYKQFVNYRGEDVFVCEGCVDGCSYEEIKPLSEVLK